jgi:3-isopropylmalate/(R)-2-methylmalate dehydratase large subunit
MVMTLAEKAISARSGRESVTAGETVLVEVDRVFCYGSGLDGVLTSVAGRPERPGRVVVARDQFSGGAETGAPSGARPMPDATLRALLREWDVANFYDAGQGGIASAFLPDTGLVGPGDLVAGMDRHALAFGALGSLVIVPDSAGLNRAILDGKMEVRVPETVRVRLDGRLQRWVGGRDLGLHLLASLDRDVVKGRSLELSGEAVGSLDMSDRLSLAASVIEMEPACVFVEVDNKTHVFVRSRSDREHPTPSSDPDADCAATLEMDLGDLPPQVRLGPGPGGIVSLDRAKDTPVDNVIIGGCNCGRIEDIRAAAHFFRDYMVSADVSLVVIPGSQQIFLHAMEEGLIQIIIRAGGQIGVSSCLYSCSAHTAAAASGGRWLSTGTCPACEHDEAEGGPISCNPSLAAVAAIMGRIQAPLDLARKMRRQATGMTR